MALRLIADASSCKRPPSGGLLFMEIERRPAIPKPTNSGSDKLSLEKRCESATQTRISTCRLGART